MSTRKDLTPANATTATPSLGGACAKVTHTRTQSGLLVTPRARPCLFALHRRELTRVNEPRAFPSVAGAKGIASATVRACQNV